MERLLVILDLDETLVYATKRDLGRAADFRSFGYSVFKRPYLDEFLSELLSSFRVAVWTSSYAGYAAEVVEGIFPDPSQLEFVWSRERCTARYDPENLEYHRIKNLVKVKRNGYSLERTLMIDDTPRKHIKNYGNLLTVRELRGDLEDRELPAVLSYVKDFLAHQPNLRAVDKRGWRTREVGSPAPAAAKVDASNEASG